MPSLGSSAAVYVPRKLASPLPVSVESQSTRAAACNRIGWGSVCPVVKSGAKGHTVRGSKSIIVFHALGREIEGVEESHLDDDGCDTLSESLTIGRIHFQCSRRQRAMVRRSRPRTKSSSPTAGPVRRGGSVEPFEPYGSRPTKSAPKSSTSKEAPALQDPEVSSGATARDLKPIPEGSTAPAHSSGAGSHGTKLHAPPTYATIVQTLQANEVPLQIPKSTQAVPAGPNPLQGQARTSEPKDRNQPQQTEGGSFLQAFVCRGESAVGDILDRVIESLDNIAVAAPG
ncbi:hypothetical protein BC835DRAFT_1310867 [Cytidiella melzeri]|nr:hypothetical protein BC835DRAFT_1310867 [Cytidiella melzeri]